MANRTPSPGARPDGDPFARVRTWYLWSVFITGLGWGIIWLASSYIVYNQSQSVVVTGLLVACMSLPSIVLPAVATRLGGTWGGARLFVVRYWAMGLSLILPVVLSALGDLHVVGLLSWFLIAGIISGLSSPATGLVRRMIAAPGTLPELNAAATRQFAISQVIGLMLGGALYATVGATWIFVLGALSCVPSAWALRPLVGRDVSPVVTGSPERFRLAFDVRHHEAGLRAATRYTALCLLIGSYTVTLPAIADLVGTNPLVLSLLQAASFAGGMFVAYATRRERGRIGWGTAQQIGLVASGLGLVVLAWATIMATGHTTRLLVVATAAIFVIGFAVSFNTSLYGSLVYFGTPEGGRTAFYTYYALVPMVVIPIGQLAIGAVADAASIGAAVGFAGVITLSLCLVSPRLASRRALDALGAAEQAASADG